MGGHKPLCIITDQDPAMKAAIDQTFDTTVHRFCIWHIMRKLSQKVGVSLCGDMSFNSQFKSCVYNSETPEEFELMWNDVIIKFGLEKNDWLSHLYAIREMWIPAYFKNLLLSKVVRATSRSESENNFFSNFTNPHLSLVEFWMRFESAIDMQRYHQSEIDHQNLSTMPDLKTKLKLEKHAAAIYTYPNFYRFQDELWHACMAYEVYDRKETDEGVMITIVNASRSTDKKRQVVYNPLTHVALCSCKMFECEGIPCRHVLCLLKGLDELPSYFITNRWTKLAANKPIYDLEGNILEGCSQIDNEERIIQNNWADILKCMHLAGRDPEKLNIVSEAIKGVMHLLEESGDNTSKSKSCELESFIGSSAPERVEILPPKEAQIKGSGRRIKGGKELKMEQQKKRKRLCRACGEEDYHDSRNCPNKLE